LFDIENKDEIICASGCLLNYLKFTQKSRLKHINKIQCFNNKDFMSLDIHTIKNLELVESMSGNNLHTVLSTIDFSKTPMGARLLKKNLLLPLMQKLEIEKRLNTIDFILTNNITVDLESLLLNYPDLERILSKIMYGNATPRELIALKESIVKGKQIYDYTLNFDKLEIRLNFSDDLISLMNTIEESVVNEPPTLYKEGGFIKKGFNSELDELIDLRYNSKKILLEIEQKEREKTNIKTLKVGFNKVFGYFIEIPKSQHEFVPKDYIRKQTLANNERYITEELKLLEDKILSAEEKSKILELEIFDSIINITKSFFESLDVFAKSVAKIDFYNSLAVCAVKRNYIKPTIVETDLLKIINGWHPVVEQIEQEKFIRNDICMDAEQNNVIILTGPNMAGKSTYLRQNALVILLAHIGSYVPAESAVIPLTDKIFTRIGAHDNLSLGLSTFMVEMIETANILNNSTKKSFIILDEVGRGTSTYDGLSIAWAVLEYIYTKIGAKTLFATHYHQMTDLEYKYSGIKNYYISAKEFDNNLIFLRKVLPGSIDKSYGIAVAKLAGLPQEVINNALQIEKELENNKIEKKNIERITIKSAQVKRHYWI
jgi:DNA mismatch repair protein MutS